MIDKLVAHPLVIHAARVARVFYIDPISILRDGGDPLLNMVRTAASIVVANDEEKAAEKARASARKGRRR